MTSATPSHESMGSELLSLPARHLHELPVETKFHLQVPGIPGDVIITTAELPEPRAVSRGAVFDGLEWVAMVTGAQSERLWARDLLRLCLRKLDEPGFRLTLDGALSGAQPVAAGWSLGRVLGRLGASLTRVELAEERPMELAEERPMELAEGRPTEPRDSMRPAA